jgi:predicted metallopeptidase
MKELRNKIISLNVTNIPEVTEDEHSNQKIRDGQGQIGPLADKLIQSVGCLEHLKKFRIRFLFSNETIKSNGKDAWGKASKFSDKDRFLHPYHFLIIISENFWKRHEDKREPLLFHELLHCGENESGKPTIIPHDLEEFGEVVKRYGAWANDITFFDRQLELFQSNLKKQTAKK